MVNKILIFSIFFWAALFYSGISFSSHFFFDSNAWDLWIFNQTLWQYSQGHIWPNTIRHVDTLLADHFEILLFLYSPLSILFWTYTLLVLQVFMILFGWWGIYLIWVFLKKENKYILLALCMYFSFFWITQAFVFDYHNNVAAIWIVPWIYYFFMRSRFVMFFTFFLIFLLAKENLGILWFSIACSLFVLSRSPIEKKISVISGFIAIGIFILLIKIFIPALNSGGYDHWEYTTLWYDMFSSLVYIILHPIDSFFLLFDTDIKREAWIYILLSGAWLLLSRSFFMIFLVLVWQKFFSDHVWISGYQFHYTVEFAPFISLAYLLFFTKRYKVTIWFVVAFINFILIFTLPIYTGETLLRHHVKYLYQFERRAEISAFLQNLPKKSTVSASNTIVPHVSFRDSIFLFPETSSAEYILVDISSNNIWPFHSIEERDMAIKDISYKKYSIFYQGKYIIVFKKNNNL